MYALNVLKRIDNAKEARDAALAGAYAAVFVAVATTLFIVIGGFARSAAVDVALFAVIAWRTSKMSRGWAVAGLVLFVLEKIVQISKGSALPVAAYVTAVFLLTGFVLGVKGTFAYQKFQHADAQPVTSSPAPL
jgi:hypothetical protein